MVLENCMMDRIQKNTDNVQFIYICEGRRDDPNIALLVFLSEGTLTCHVLLTQIYAKSQKEKRQRNKYKNRMAEMGKNWPIPNVPTGNEGPDGELLLRKQ